MQLKLATWNINSVRLRINLAERLLEEYQPDVLCLQETKCPNDAFPSKAFRKAGYEHIAFHGQKGYHGVATISRIPFSGEERRDFCNMGDTRHLAVTLDIGKGVRVHNYYVPAGGDVPDPEVNDKFAHKLAFLTEMERWYKGHKNKKDAQMILVGDLNVAPLEEDVWSHRQLLKVVSHTPVEVEHLTRVMKAHDWQDVMRRFVPEDEKLYTWWSYRARDWEKSDRGRRLDHVWVTPALTHAPKAMQVIKQARGWERSSDHAPVLTTFEI